MKILRKIKEFYIWLTSKQVLAAINDGASYDEVQQIVQKEARG